MSYNPTEELYLSVERLAKVVEGAASFLLNLEDVPESITDIVNTFPDRIRELRVLVSEVEKETAAGNYDAAHDKISAVNERSAGFEFDCRALTTFINDNFRKPEYDA